MATVIVHGTFDPQGTWWRTETSGSFLAGFSKGTREGMAEPDVWTIGGRPVRNYAQLTPKGGWSVWKGRKKMPFQHAEGCFRWSGADLHDAGRLTAGEELANYLGELAQIAPGEPIHIIAHSHGCNVVKLATQKAAAQVTFGKLVFLAAPHLLDAASQQPLYPLNGKRLKAPYPTVLNIYSPDDKVQVGIADAMPDLGLPPGMPKTGLFGFAGTPVVKAFREDPDAQVAGIYENLEIPTKFGRSIFAGIEAHSAMHSNIIGRLAGFWLARWPHESGIECLKHVGFDGT